MFKLDPSANHYMDLALIDSDYQVLHFDEVDILFSGLNKFGTRIVGTFVEADYVKGIERFFHVLVDLSTYALFLNEQITYQALLQDAKPIFVVDKTVKQNSSEPPEIYVIDFLDIPEEYRPLPNSYCPEQDFEPSFTYPVSLKGKIAEYHEAVPEEVGRVQNLIADLFRNPFKRLKTKKFVDIKPTVLLAASYSPTSFRINYKISIEPTKTQATLFNDASDYNKFLNKYISYCLNNLPRDIETLLEATKPKPEKFIELRDTYFTLIGMHRVNPPDVEQTLIEELLRVAEDLDEISHTVGVHFNQIALANLATDGEKLLGVIGESYKKKMQDTVSKIDLKTGKVQTDQEPQRYRIYIYDLNTDTRIGHAHAEHPDKDRVAKPRIIISGHEPLAETKYTESLYYNKYISVLGKAKKVDGVPRNIEIEYEPT